MTQRSSIVVILVACGLLVATAVRAEDDHLIAHKIKDPSKFKPTGTHTIETASGTATCELKGAKFLLMQGEKDGGDDPRGGQAGNFVCYKAKCTGGLPSSATDVEDQFSTLSLEAKKSQLVCLPANPVICGDGELDAGEQCDGAAGTCLGSCQGDCTCTVATCGDTTGGFCWFAAAPNESCDTTCAAAGRTYDSATASYAGSGGNLSNCAVIVSQLGFIIATGADIACADGAGCYHDGSIPVSYRCTTPATTSTALPGATNQRICACQ